MRMKIVLIKNRYIIERKITSNLPITVSTGTTVIRCRRWITNATILTWITITINYIIRSTKVTCLAWFVWYYIETIIYGATILHICRIFH